MAAVRNYGSLIVIIVFLSSVPLNSSAYNCYEKNFCDRVQCDVVEDCSAGVLVDGGGVCGCCQVCLAFLDFGVTCNPNNTIPKNLRIAVPLDDTSREVVTPFCHPKLACNPKVGCTYHDLNDTIVYYDPLPESCYLLHDYYEETLQTSVHNKLWAWEPQCDAIGNYLPTQCKGDIDDRRCYCVNEQGDTIFGQDFGKDGEMACECSRAVDKLEKESSVIRNLPYLRCDALGNFEDLQCSDGKCYCVNSTTGQILSSTVPMSIMNILPCYNSSIYSSDYYTSCEKEKLRLESVRKKLFSKGIKMVIEEEPICDPDGSYGPRQCAGLYCFCADRDGQQIQQYVLMSNNVAAAVMMCKCARDEIDSALLSDKTKQRQCTAKGDYDVYQCQGGLCYCVDEDGQQTSNSRERWSESFCKLYCAKKIVMDINTNPCMSLGP